MDTTHVTYDIPTPLNDILAIYADGINDDTNTIITDSLARLTQHTLTVLAMRHPEYILPAHAIHALRNSHSLTKPSHMEVVLLNLTLYTRYTRLPTIFTLHPCKRTRGYLCIQKNLLTLINTARQTAPMSTFITRALFDGLEYRLTLGGNHTMQQEHIPATSTAKEQRYLLAELRDLKRRITNLEAMQTPPTGTAELLTQIVLTLAHEAATSIQQGGVHEKVS